MTSKQHVNDIYTGNAVPGPNLRLGKVTAAAYKIEAVEILTSLKKLVGELSAEERSFLQDHMTSGLAAFEKVAAEDE